MPNYPSLMFLLHCWHGWAVNHGITTAFFPTCQQEIHREGLTWAENFFSVLPMWVWISKSPDADVTGQWAASKNKVHMVQTKLRYQTKWIFLTHLCDFFCDIVSPVFDLWCYDGCLWCWRRMSLLFSPLREVECNQRDLADGAILVDVRIRGRAKQAGRHVIKRA